MYRDSGVGFIPRSLIPQRLDMTLERYGAPPRRAREHEG